MSEVGALESLQALHRELLAACEHRFDNAALLEQSLLVHGDLFRGLLDKPGRNNTSRTTVQSGKITVADEEYSLNANFIDGALKLADELDYDEVAAAKLLLEAQADQEVLDRSPLECGIIRFHRQREFILDCMRLCIQLSNDSELDPDTVDFFGSIVNESIYGVATIPSSGQQRFIPRCMAAMKAIKLWLQQITEKVAAASFINPGGSSALLQFQEAIEFSRLSLIKQHELLATIMCGAIEQHQAKMEDLVQFMDLLKKSDKYDHLLVHSFPSLGALISHFGSPEGTSDLRQARELNKIVCQQSDDESWSLVYLRASVRAWWIAEYSGFYVDDTAGTELQGIDLDEEDMQRSKQFLDALKDGAFAFMLSIAADSQDLDCSDPDRLGMRQWLLQKSPQLTSDPVQFSDFFRKSLMQQLEVFVDAFISNLPDVLRKLRTEEDEQRQLSQTHEQDLDLERFLLIIGYAYDGRPEAAEAFWSDPDSNLAGFLHWASRRASTPLVSAFCEMLQSLSDNEENATAAHEFLLDEGHHATGKMRRSQSLSWSQIFRELFFFTNKIRDRTSPTQANIHRGGKPSSEQAESEPESAMMLKCYLRLITKLASRSEIARNMLLRGPDFNLTELLFELASTSIPAALRACVFYALQALISSKDQAEGYVMWRCVDNWLTGSYTTPPNPQRATATQQSNNPTSTMAATLDEIGQGFDQPNAFTKLLTSLVTPIEGYEPLNDTLPFPEDLGSSVRMPGVEQYVDYVLGYVFATTSKEIQNKLQLRLLRLTCLDFAMACLTTFNEDLIIIGNRSNVAIDSAVSTTDLASYVQLHPFARVMEWMFDDRIIRILFSTIHQDAEEVGGAPPDSPLILGILRAVEVVTKVLDLQDTYLNLVRPIIKPQSRERQQTTPKASFASFEDGLVNHLDLVVNLGKFCVLGSSPLTLACLNLLRQISTSSKMVAAWTPRGGRNGHRNKAIVALEKDGNADSIALTLSAELTATLDVERGTSSANYEIKVFILDFLYECLKADPDHPNIAHLLLGFQCGINTLSIEPRGSFDTQESLFHSLLTLFLELPYGDNEEVGLRGWMVALKYKALRILQVLWRSRLSAPLVMDELRTLLFPFHLLMRQILIQPNLLWDGQEASSPEFLISRSSQSYLDFISIRAIAFEYIGKELCSVSQARLPALKREVIEGLGGQIRGNESEPIVVPNIFDLFDFMPLDNPWEIQTPEFNYYKDLDLKSCAAVVDSIITYDVAKVRQILLLKRNESRNAGQVIPQNDMSAVEREEALLLEYLEYSNREKKIATARLTALQAWVNLVVVIIEANDFKETDKASFFQQGLQTIIPSMSTFSTDGQAEAFELARLARVFLFKVESGSKVAAPPGLDKQAVAKATPISDKLFQVFQICLHAIGRWAGDSELRSIYYSICYLYLTGIVDNGQGFSPGRHKTVKALHSYGERFLNVVCDDAYSSDGICQTAAMILLGAVVSLEKDEDDTGIIDTLNRLNFIGILVDSLKTLLEEWLEIIRAHNTQAEHYTTAKLSLLLQLSQTRAGAKHALHAGLFRAIEQSGLFAADPELVVDASDTAALEKHYAVLARTARVIGAAVLSTGGGGGQSHSVAQARRFLQQHRLLVAHTLKRSAGVGGAAANGAGGAEVGARLEERVEDLAEAFMVVITASGFLEFEDDQVPAERPRQSQTLFH